MTSDIMLYCKHVNRLIILVSLIGDTTWLKEKVEIFTKFTECLVNGFIE